MIPNDPWQSYIPGEDREISGSTGVYQVGDADGNVIYIGKATPRDRFGLRGCVAAHFQASEPNETIRNNARYFRCEVTTMYYSRWVDVISRFVRDEGRLPSGNLAGQDELPALARFGNA